MTGFEECDEHWKLELPGFCVCEVAGVDDPPPNEQPVSRNNNSQKKRGILW